MKFKETLENKNSNTTESFQVSKEIFDYWSELAEINGYKSLSDFIRAMICKGLDVSDLKTK